MWLYISSQIGWKEYVYSFSWVCFLARPLADILLMTHLGNVWAWPTGNMPKLIFIKIRYVEGSFKACVQYFQNPYCRVLVFINPWFANQNFFYVERCLDISLSPSGGEQSIELSQSTFVGYKWCVCIKDHFMW